MTISKPMAAPLSAPAARGSVAGAGGVVQGSGDILSSVIESARPFGSFQSWVARTDWKQGRNRRECEAIAQAVDALLSKNKRLAVEILVRRLGGVHLADHTENWDACDALQCSSYGGSLFPRDELKRAMRDADRMNRFNRGSKDRSGSGLGSGYRGRRARGGSSTAASSQSVHNPSAASKAQGAVAAATAK